MKTIKILILASLILCTSSTALTEVPKRLTFIFQKQKDPARIKADADKVAAFLKGELSTEVQAQVPSGYASSVQALVSKTADIAYLDSVGFLLARRDGDAELLLVEERVDLKGKPRTDYDSVFVVRKDSPLKTIEDLIKAASSQRMVFTSPTSTSGYIMAYRRLVNEGLLRPKQDPQAAFKSVSFGGSYGQALEQVLNDRGDVAAVSHYTMEGPSSAKYLSDQTRSQLRILARSPGVPTHVIAVRGSLSDETKDQIKEAILKIGKESPELLADVYGASSFVEASEDQHVQATVEAVQYLGLPIEGLMKKKKS